ncbi:hypothetical protein B9Z51_00355 [Limnohabitans sp. T6-5]|uniref:YDG domain-containing protein n=1 Tax=Limnohabitans sp. T6-5 TaxID=1100724 RepID=UPI000D3450B4|nr:YDG domain-containing protein [Limnohabitans sp. T6-5]PUE10843.1 hypothetical protein B9Z51_00355 [Limnohabitans sp. T6-5]
MNSNLFKTVFSQRLGALIAVGEHTCGQGKATGGHAAGHVNLWASAAAGASYFGVVSLGFAFVSLAWAAPANNALPSGGQVAQGTAAISQSRANMAIQQSTARAVVNWQSFDIGKDAKVNIVQPNAQAVLLNRVTGAAPSQIFGQMSANGQVVLVNPNGVTFGKDGSVSAAGLTASTLNTSDADFMAGRNRFTRDGATGEVVNQGTLSAAPGGYVALLGASVSNEGKIYAPQGHVALGAAEVITLPMTGSGRIKMALSPSAINAAVANQKGGTIVTEGGQVYMQAAAVGSVVGSAMASVLQSGSIDTSGEQGGAVHLLADSGTIKVDGSINANSTGKDDKGLPRKGGDIIIGRDTDTGVLSKTTDVSGAKLESVGALIETSGSNLKFNGVSVLAKNWLLDPVDVSIDAASAATIGTNLGTTDVTIQTTGSTLGVTTAGTGNIFIESAITKAAAAGADTTLTLLADNGIILNAMISAAAGAGKLNVVMEAKGQTDGVAVGSMTAAQRAASQGVYINTYATYSGYGGINANGGDVTITGTSYAATGGQSSALGKGVLMVNNTNISANNITITGTAENQSGETSYGVVLQRFPGRATLTATGDINLTGTLQGAGNGSGLYTSTSSQNTNSQTLKAGGNITIQGNNRASTSNTSAAIYLRSGLQVEAVGNIVLKAETNNSAALAMDIYSGAQNYEGNASFRSVNSSGVATGNVLIQSNQGGILLYNQMGSSAGALTSIEGKNISIDNTGGTVDAITGAITRGTGKSTSNNAGINIADGRAITASNNINLLGVGTTGNGVAITGAAALSANVAGNTGDITIEGENTTASGAAINISNAASTLTARNIVTLTSGGTGSGTSLVAAGNIAVGTQLLVTTPAAGTISGVISGTGSLLKSGAGQLSLTAVNGTTYGTNTFAGGITVSQGTLLLGHGGGNYNKTAGTGAIVVGDTNTGSNNVALLLEKGVPDNTSGPLTRDITFTNNGTGTATLGTTVGIAGDANRGWTSANSKITFNRDILINDATADRFTLDGQFTGTGNITFSGTRITMSTLTGNGISANDFVGDVTISSGTMLQASAKYILPSTTNLTNNGNFRLLNGSDQTIDALNGSGTITTTGSLPTTVSVGNHNGSGNFSGTIVGVSPLVNLVKNGTGTQVLSGANNYAGTTVINDGTLQIGNGGTSGTIGTGAITDNAALVFNRSDAGLVVSAKISGTGTVTQAGTGTTILSADNDWSGDTTISAGTLQVGNGGTTGTLGTSTTITDNGTLAFKRSDNISADLKITGTGGLTQAGSGTLTLLDSAALYGVNDYSGATTISAGTLQVGNGGTSGHLGTGAIVDSGTLAINHSDDVTLSQAISGGGGLTQSGAGTTTLTGANTYSGTTTISSGVLQVGDGGTSGSVGTGAVIDNASLVFKRSDTLWVSGVISGTGAITQAGTGTTILANNNTYAGTTTISSGTLQVGSGYSTGSLGTGAILDNGALVFNRGDSGLVVSAKISGTGSVTQAGSGGTTTLTAENDWSGTTTISAGTLQIGNGGTTGTLGTATTVTTNGTLSFKRSDNLSVGLKITGTGGLTQAGSGTLTLIDSAALNGANTYSGTTTISAGTLQVGDGGTSGNLGTGSVLDNGSLVFNRSDTLTISGNMGGSGTVAQSGTGTTILTGNNSYAGATTVNTGTLQIGNGAALGSLGVGAASVAANANLNFKRSDAAYSITPAITGAGNLNFLGTGVQGQSSYSLSANNSSFTGNINITSARLNVSAATQIGATSPITVNSGGQLFPNGNFTLSNPLSLAGTGWNESAGLIGALRMVGGVNYAGNITLAADARIATYGTGSAATISGVISGTPNIEFASPGGVGTITLTGNNTYTGSTTISSGILQVGNSGTTGTLGTGAVVDNGTLTLKRSDAITLANAISGTGALTQAGAGTTTLTANNTYSGITTISTGTLQVGNGGTTGTLGTGAITDNAALVFNRSNAVSVPGVISGTGTLTQSGTGTTTLTGNNTYTGGTTVSTGMLQIGDGTNNGQIGSGITQIASGATLNFNVKSASTANYSTTNTFTGAGTLQKTGAGTLTWGTAVAVFGMSGGLIDVQAGTLIGANFGNEVWTNNKASLNVATGATFVGAEGAIFVDALTGGGAVTSGYAGYAYNLTVGVNNGSGTFSGVIQDANGVAAKLSKTGTGTQILTGTNTYTGVTTISDGVLQVGNGGTTGTLGTGAVTDNAALVFNRSDALTVANVISGTGTLTQSGAGTTTLTGNNSYAGTTTISAGTLQVGSGSTTGTLGTGAVIDNASLVFNRSNTLLVANAISGIGTLSQTGTGTTQLSADNSYAGTTTVSGGTLQVGNAGSTGTLGAGSVTLSNNANLSYVRSAATTVANNISGTGNVLASITGAVSNLTVDHTISLTGGTVNLVTDGNLSVTQAISTTNATSAAVFLEAGKSTAAGTATGGNVSLSGSGAVTVGTGGRITYETGSLTGSTGLGVVAGNNRYNSDETTTNYTAALGAGAYAVYREQPLVTVQVNNASKTYDGISFSGGSLSTSLAAGSLVNGDTFAAVTANANYGGTAQGAKNASVTPYVISASDTGGTSSNLNALGYGVSYTSGTLTVSQKEVSLAAAKTYDGVKTLSGTQLSITTGVGSETLNYTSATIASKNVADNSSNYVDAITLTDGTGLASNYKAPSLSAAAATKNTATLTAKSVTLDSISAASKTYDGTTAATITAGVIRGTALGETLSVTGTGVFADKKAATGVVVTVADVTTLTKANGTGDWGNYSLSTTGVKSTSADISKKDLVISATASDKTYDATTLATASLSSDKITGDTLTLAQTSASFDNKNVGTGKTVTVAGLAISGTDAGNYNLTNSTATTTAAISKKDLVISATASDKTYDATTLATASLSSDKIAGDTLTLAQTGASFDTKNVGTGKTVTVTGLAISGTDADNYNLTNSTATTTAAVSKKDLVISATASDKTYDATTLATASLSSDKIAGDTLTLAQTGASFDNKNVGTGKTVTVAGLAISGTDADNYNLTNTTATTTAAVTKKDLVISATASDKTYDATTLATASLSSDKIAGDTLTLAQTGASFDNKNVGTGKTVTVAGLAISGTDADNYNLTNTTATTTAAVTKKDLVISATASDKTYDATTLATVSLSSDKITGDTLTLAQIGATFDTKNVGTGKTVTVEGLAISGTDADNYNLTNTSATTTATISKKDLVISATASDKTYDATTLATASLSSDKITGDTLTLAQTGATFDTKNVGTGKTVTVAGLAITGTDAGNYNLTNSTATTTAAISKKDLVISATASDKTYDATTLATASLSSDKIAGDTLTLAQTGASFDTKNVGTGKTVTVAGLAISGTDVDNYNLTNSTTTTTANITPKDLTLSSITAASKTYDGNTTAAITQVGLTGFVGSETLGATATGSFVNKNAGLRTVNVSTANTTLTDDLASGGLTSNYQLVAGSVGSATTIAPKDAVVTANSDVSKVYNGANQTVSGFTATGLVNGETAAVLTGVNAGATGKNAGTYNAIASGTDNNYALSFIAGRLVIAPKEAEVAVSPLTAVSNGTLFTQAPATKSGFVTGEDVVVNGLASGIAAGTYNSQIQVAPANSATVLDNYLIKIVNAALLITPNAVAVPPVRPVFLSGPPTITSRLSWAGFSGVNTNTSSAQRANSDTAASGGAASLTSAVPSGNAFPQVCTPEGLQECDCAETSIESVEICLSPASKQ